MATVSERIKDLIKPSVEALGFDLWGLQYLPQGNKTILRVYIESPNGITVDDCAKVSRQISSILDVENPINNTYTLEVSSPGLERFLYELDQYKLYIGKEIKVKLHEAIDQRRIIVGTLVAVHDDETIEIAMDEQHFRFGLDQVQSANLLFS
jgi:ribosome maturation factor RimP